LPRRGLGTVRALDIWSGGSYSTGQDNDLSRRLPPARPPRRAAVPLPRGLAGLGWGLPLALGAKAAQPQSPVICVTGDGGLGHVWAELETAVRERLAVTIIVLNNSILGFQKHAELANFGAHTSAIGFGPVDHAAIARAVGATGIKIEAVADLTPALEKALASESVTLLDVITDPGAYPPITAWEGKHATLTVTS
jgi:acetolactate synthase-1/2/3 large subunit